MEAAGDVSGLDTGWIIIGGGMHTVAVEQEGGHIAYVQASRRRYYDPRIHEAFVDAAQRSAERAHMRAQSTREIKWCCHCGDERNRSYFYADARNKDGLDSWCSVCRKKQKREKYELDAAAEGRTVRAYTRREATVIEVDFAPIRKAA